jgi:hypothetical protein
LDQVKFQIKAIATKRVIFLVQNLKRVGHDFSRAVQRDVRDVGWSTGTRMVAGHDFSRAVQRDARDVGWSTGTRMVAVEVAIGTAELETQPDDRGSESGVVAPASIDGAPDAVKSDTLLPIVAPTRKQR